MPGLKCEPLSKTIVILVLIAVDWKFYITSLMGYSNSFRSRPNYRILSLWTSSRSFLCLPVIPILVIVDRLFKQFILTHNTITSAQLAKLFIIHVFSKHGVPRHVTSDHRSKFVSHFFWSLGKALNMKLHFTQQRVHQTVKLGMSTPHVISNISFNSSRYKSGCCFTVPSRN